MEKGELDIMEKGDTERGRERTVIFPLCVSGSLVCDMSVSVGTSCLSLPICFFFFYPSRYPLLLRPLPLLYFSLLRCLVIVQPCRADTHTHTDTHTQRQTDRQTDKHTQRPYSLIPVMYPVFLPQYLSMVAVQLGLKSWCVYHNRWWSINTDCGTNSQAKFERSFQMLQKRGIYVTWIQSATQNKLYYYYYYYYYYYLVLK